MKYLFIFLLTLLIGIIGVITYGIFKKSPGKPIVNVIQTATRPTFSIAEAPSESIRGIISQMSGSVFWTSRVATESSRITTPVTLQQGEEIQTGDNGNLDITFSKEVSIRIEPRTQIDFIQTLPVNFVASIASGSADFKKISSNPVSIRSYHLLMNLTGEMMVTVDLDKGFTNINLISGNVTAAYNDKNLDSHVANFSAPRSFTFNDLTREFVF